MIIWTMSTLEDFKKYVTGSGVNFDELSNREKLEWREGFDRSRGKDLITSLCILLFRYCQFLLCWICNIYLITLTCYLSMNAQALHLLCVESYVLMCPFYYSNYQSILLCVESVIKFLSHNDVCVCLSIVLYLLIPHSYNPHLTNYLILPCSYIFPITTPRILYS